MIKTEGNTLFPIFLKLDQFNVLIVGGGNIALEKINAIVNNSPGANITVVAKDVVLKIEELEKTHSNIEILKKEYEVIDLINKDLVIVAVNNKEISKRIKVNAEEKKILTNVADTPELCDFYLGSIIKKGDLKIAISTNGKSPTVAKRIREVLDDFFPDEMENVLNNLSIIRTNLKGDFSERVKQLNAITNVLVSKKKAATEESKWKKIATFSLVGFAIMILTNILLIYFPVSSISDFFNDAINQTDSSFYLMILGGFLAQLVDGAVGMGYGVTAVTFLLTLGISPAAVSSSVHTAEIFASGASGYNHYKFRNVNKKLFKTLLIPGVIGAVLGAFLLSELGAKYGNYIKPIIAFYTLLLGIRIISKAFRKNKTTKRMKRVGWLAGFGGFLDSFGGGGWGPIVTTTLISNGRSPRYTIGSVSLTEFFVTLASALAFFSLIGISHWQIIAGLIIGGLAAAPLAAKLSGRMPLKTTLISVGILVIIVSVRILVLTIAEIL